MPLDKIGINIENMNPINTTPDIIIKTDPTEFINDIPAKANIYTKDLVGVGIMLALTGYLYYILADNSEVQGFNYSQIRSVGLSFGISGLIGLVMFALGYFRQLYPVIAFIIICMLCVIWVYKEER